LNLADYQQQVSQVHVADALIDYCQDILLFSRHSHDYRHGLSPRAGLAILQGARAWAFLEGRKLVLPEDLQAVLPATVGHRLQAAGDCGDNQGDGMVNNLLSAVPVP
ncbi:MAG: AAA family ATPase, partial [Candidatus Thiodiazotropha sp. (ex Lucinoma kastoroae)]|nr:AAA family ATPase [Candidatus Thiodiazotropha sp. (ex Lucinoma kastoroae)]